MAIEYEDRLAGSGCESRSEITSLVVANPLVDPLWQQLVLHHPSSIFNSPRWMQVLSDTYALEFRANILLSEDGAPRAGVAYAEVQDVGGAERLVSLPFSDYCDPVAGDEGDWGLLVATLIERGQVINLRCLHNPVPLSDDRFALVNRAKWHGADLRPGVEELWGGLDSSARRAVRKAEREGVEVIPAQDEADLRAFYEMHLRIRKYKYRMLAQPYSFFLNLWRNTVDLGKGFLLLARVGSQVVGGVFFLEWKDTLYYKFNASDPAFLNYRPNDSIIWTAIQRAIEQGLARLDFGLSDWDQEELSRYKRKYAGEEKTISFLKHIPAGLVESGAEFRGSLKQLADLLTEESVPDDVTGRAGDILYRYFL